MGSNNKGESSDNGESSDEEIFLDVADENAPLIGFNNYVESSNSRSNNDEKTSNKRKITWSNDLALRASIEMDQSVFERPLGRVLTSVKWLGSAAIAATAGQGLCGLIMHYAKGTFLEVEDAVYSGDYQIFASESIASNIMIAYVSVTLSTAILKQFLARGDIILRTLSGKTRFQAVKHDDGPQQDLTLKRTGWHKLLKGTIGVSGACTTLIVGMEFLKI